MAKWMRIALVLVLAFAAAEWWTARAPSGTADTPAAAEGDRPAAVAPRTPGLPNEAVATLALIERGGPYPYDRDGTTFQNREGRLPARPRGYYREYTVPTPGAPDRGARRIVAGGSPPEVYYYTDDHYRSFRRLEIDR